MINDKVCFYYSLGFGICLGLLIWACPIIVVAFSWIYLGVTVPMKCYSFFAVFISLIFTGCHSDSAGISAEDSVGSADLRLVNGARSSIPISSGEYTVTFEHLGLDGWETVLTKRGMVVDDQGITIAMARGVDIEREIVYGVENYSAGYRAPESLPGKVVWQGGKPMGDGLYLIVGLSGEGGIRPCVTARVLAEGAGNDK